MTDFDTKTPRVDELMDDARRRSGIGKENALNGLFCIANELPVLARQLEIELQEANEKIAELQNTLLKDFMKGDLQ